MPPDVAQSF